MGFGIAAAIVAAGAAIFLVYWCIRTRRQQEKFEVLNPGPGTESEDYYTHDESSRSLYGSLAQSGFPTPSYSPTPTSYHGIPNQR
jgi:hypothetical protein